MDRTWRGVIPGVPNEPYDLPWNQWNQWNNGLIFWAFFKGCGAYRRRFKKEFVLCPNTNTKTTPAWPKEPKKVVHDGKKCLHMWHVVKAMLKLSTSIHPSYDMPTSTNTEIPFLACCTYRYIVTYRILHTSKKPSPATLVVGFRSVDLVNFGFFKTGGGVLFLGKKTTDALKRFVWILMYFDVFGEVTRKARPSKSSEFPGWTRHKNWCCLQSNWGSSCTISMKLGFKDAPDNRFNRCSMQVHALKVTCY